MCLLTSNVPPDDPESVEVAAFCAGCTGGIGVFLAAFSSSSHSLICLSAISSRSSLLA